jgi:hypothetical protein
MHTHPAKKVCFGGSHAASVRGFASRRRDSDQEFCILLATGLENYLYFRSLGATMMDFLFPDATWESKERLYGGHGSTPVLC